ncbi:hypothetical protein G6011_00594 [Alternaria panax]|uniref:Uncharacterized protein n=1 Tax=Alternaria panax TaxID=48097 RepID=A0AAD4NV47_9PLEO|nr:hypothetical protein G6011_00594 [Alternaria panax]
MSSAEKRQTREQKKEAEEREIVNVIANVQDEATQIDIVMKKRRCFGPALSEPSRFYSIVQDYVNSDTNAEEVAKKLVTPINNAILQNRKNLHFLDLWYSIIHSAKRLPFRDTIGLDKLVTLIQAIKSSFPPPTAKDQDIYTCLRDFGMAARETMNDCPGCGSGYLLLEVHAYANMLYFYALLTVERVSNFWIYCIWEMRSALETPLEDDALDGAHHPGTAIQKYNATIPSAAAWIFAAGKQVYAREYDLTPKRATEGNPGRGGPLWEGRPEFSKKRWALWKKRFGELAGLEGLTDEVKEIARECAEAMDRIDGGAK